MVIKFIVFSFVLNSKIMENNITAVQFIKEQIELHSDTSFFNIDWDRFDEVIEKAKAMEKEQLIMFGAQCMVEVEKESGLGAIKIYELYFDKTFKSE